MVTKPKLYMDSCGFIDTVKEEVGNLPPDRSSDGWYIKQILRAHAAADVALHTSMLALAECVAIESGQSEVPKDIQDRFRRLLSSGQYVRLVTPTPRTGTIVQNLRWKHGIVLGGPDAIHIAAALEMGCTEFLSSDERLKKEKLKAVLPQLRSLGLRLIRPCETQSLPAKYSQGNIFDGSSKKEK